MKFNVNDKDGLEAAISVIKEQFRMKGRVKVAVEVE